MRVCLLSNVLILNVLLIEISMLYVYLQSYNVIIRLETEYLNSACSDIENERFNNRTM